MSDGSTAGFAGSSASRRPDRSGFAEHDGVRIAWSQYGASGPDVVLIPPWAIVPSRVYKAQVPYLSRHFRVTTFDSRGTGDSDRPLEAAAYADDVLVADTFAVMDAAGVDRAVLAGLSLGGSLALQAAARLPERVVGVASVCVSAGVEPGDRDEALRSWAGPPDPTGADLGNRELWLSGADAYSSFLSWFFATMFVEPHSTKQVEDCVGWGHLTSPEVLAAATAGGLGLDGSTPVALGPLCPRIVCPVLLIHGTHDRVSPSRVSERLAALIDGAELVLVEGGGHGVHARDPVRVNREIKDFVDRVHHLPSPSDPAPRRWTRALSRPRKVLYLSSPIGMGHARRDLAVAEELQVLHPDVEIDWLSQHPVTTFLEAAGQRVHPASRWMTSENHHIEGECSDHDLAVFQAMRDMDEIVLHNFMVFLEVLEGEHYDLVVGDEAWEVDHFLHENPELKNTAFAWMTDFVGWIPMREDEEATTTDYNAEMVEHRARFPGVRDRSVFVGSPDDVLPAGLGDGLPGIREWTSDHYDFAGYVAGSTPVPEEEVPGLRQRLGYRADSRVCLVSVGGSGVGASLLQRVADAVPALRRADPSLEVVLVTGPRIDPGIIAPRRGLRVEGYLPDLPAHLAACDVALVQGGLTTCMELTGQRRPFVYVPLRNHFEQNHHVRHRLDRYGAGHHLPYEEASEPERLAEAIVAAAASPVDYRPVETDGAARAARLLSDLL